MDITQLMVKLAMAGASAWVMWGMVVLSVVSVTVMLERFIFFSRNAGDPAATEATIREQLTRGTPQDTIKALSGRMGLEIRTLTAGLEAADRGVAAMEEVMDGALKVERLRFERGLAFLGTVGNNAPFIGLFGTVVEIIRALHELGEKSGVGATAVMGRLSEALAATAVGLLVALPAVAAYNYFQRKLKMFTTTAEALTHTLKGYLHQANDANGNNGKGA
ncbi:MAG: MotA/TolQ/ExbB proton channel family protein [Deltaproteobacteria bacterium]|nr:MotA/TolQ/ExbB proton channel family protein [Deltaproteobacteria bacterium]